MVRSHPNSQTMPPRRNHAHRRYQPRHPRAAPLRPSAPLVAPRRQVSAAKREQSSAISSYSRTLKRELDADLKKHMEDERRRLQAEHSAELEAKKAALAARLSAAAAAKLDALETAQQLQEAGAFDVPGALLRGQRAVLSAVAGMGAEGPTEQDPSGQSALVRPKAVQMRAPHWVSSPLHSYHANDVEIAVTSHEHASTALAALQLT
jgi:hypothetical protein